MSYSGQTSSIFLIDKIIKSFSSDCNLRIAFLGYHDLMATPDEWTFITNGRNEQLKNRPNQKKIISIHGREHDVKFSPTIGSWLALVYGSRITYDVFDFTLYEGSEIVHDFNYPLPATYEKQYDLVLDLGTCEHIFNLPQALLNILNMIKINGMIYHGGPIAMLNHGFYGYNPTLFCDFYGDNGCEINELWIESMQFVNPNTRTRVCIRDVPKFDRFNLNSVFSQSPELAFLEYNLNVVLTKKFDTAPVRYPIQQKYRDLEQWR